jgi:hypothetical protein
MPPAPVIEARIIKLGNVILFLSPIGDSSVEGQKFVRIPSKQKQPRNVYNIIKSGAITYFGKAPLSIPQERILR